MLTKFRIGLTLAAVAMLTAETNAIRLGHEIDAASGAIVDDCADGNCMVTEGGSDVSIMGADGGEVAVDVDGGDDSKEGEGDCGGCCGGNNVDIDISFEVNASGSEEPAATEDAGEEAATTGEATTGGDESSTTTTTTTTTTTGGDATGPTGMDSTGSTEGSATVNVVDNLSDAATGGDDAATGGNGEATAEAAATN